MGWRSLIEREGADSCVSGGCVRILDVLVGRPHRSLDSPSRSLVEEKRLRKARVPGRPLGTPDVLSGRLLWNSGVLIRSSGCEGIMKDKTTGERQFWNYGSVPIGSLVIVHSKFWMNVCKLSKTSWNMKILKNHD
ncbi:unnamed protein product [Ilex paraguariensis]|uniref:Uncharacterized protein n=1 Tax=Ilex paraguariensis TaxID=185542 RepID=A0ABC8RXC9_9AQUA